MQICQLHNFPCYVARFLVSRRPHLSIGICRVLAKPRFMLIACHSHMMSKNAFMSLSAETTTYSCSILVTLRLGAARAGHTEAGAASLQSASAASNPTGCGACLPPECSAVKGAGTFGRLAPFGTERSGTRSSGRWRCSAALRLAGHGDPSRILAVAGIPPFVRAARQADSGKRHAIISAYAGNFAIGNAEVRACMQHKGTGGCSAPGKFCP